MVETPHKNGCVEQKHRHILNVGRALRFQANLPIKFWGKCIMVTGHLINHTPSVTLHGKTTFEVLYGKSPSLDHICTFGCLFYAHSLNRSKDKFESGL